MEVCFVIRFKPQEVRDYSHDLLCSTEREKFIVPIRAVGSRPLMNFPDELAFGSCPVKSSTRKMMFVQNIGTSTARFRLRTRDLMFSCSAEDYMVEPGSSQMIEVSFTPPSAQECRGEIEVEFTKGVSCFIIATGTGKNVDVSLSTPR